MTAPQQYDANDILMGGGGAPAAKFETPGTTIGGRIVSRPQAFQEREYDRNNPGKGALKFFPSGDPIMALSVDVQTSLRDMSIRDDDGTRRIYVQGKRLKDAIRDAIRNAGAPGLEVGGELHVTFIDLDHQADTQIKPKLWSARYIPAGSAEANTVLGVAPTTEPAPAAPAAAPAAGVDPAVAAALAALTPEQRAAMGLPAA